MVGENFGSIVLYVVIVLVAFLLCREFFCWYWKINKIIHLLEKIAKVKEKHIDGVSSIKDIERDLKQKMEETSSKEEKK